MTRYCLLLGYNTCKIKLKGDYIKFSARKFSYDLTSNDGNHYTSTPQYPPIFDTSSNFRKEKKVEEWHTTIQNVKTVEEKLYSVNMPTYYGWKKFDLTEQFLPYNTLRFFEHITRTKFVQQDSAINEPPKDNSTIQIDKDVTRADNTAETSNEVNLIRRVKSQVELALIFEYEHRR